jgi:ferrous iron transport protein A
LTSWPALAIKNADHARKIQFQQRYPEINMAEINLRQMKKDQSGIISSIKVGGELGLRMREMGLVPGTQITIQGRAPLNDPVALRIMGGILTLRNNEADHITVTVEESD